jgi:hypothetical protein
MSKRWIAKITYNNGKPKDVFEIEELHELQDRVEMGPDWNTINKITIRLNEDAT